MEIKQFEKEFTELKAKMDKREAELKNAKDIQSQLSMTVNDEKIAIKRINEMIATFKNSLIDLENLIDAHERESSLIVDRIKCISNELLELNKDVERKKEQLKQLREEALCQSSLDATNKNSYYAILKKNTATTPIITEYCKSDKKYMILDAKMQLPGLKKFSYIVVRSNKTIIGTQENIPTMSELKSVAEKPITGVTIPRMQYLKEHILSVIKNQKSISPNSIIPLEESCPIGGQSDFNQCGYGWEWDWSYGIGDYTEGTYYGEMTGFMVIGIRINPSEYY